METGFVNGFCQGRSEWAKSSSFWAKVSFLQNKQPNPTNHKGHDPLHHIGNAAMYPLSSSKARQRNKIRILGRKVMMDQAFRVFTVFVVERRMQKDVQTAPFPCRNWNNGSAQHLRQPTFHLWRKFHFTKTYFLRRWSYSSVWAENCSDWAK